MSFSNEEIYKYFDEFSVENALLVRQFLSRIPFHKSYAQKSVLDFGSGTGCLAFEISKEAGFVTGIEIDDLLVGYSNKRLREFPASQRDKVCFVNKKIEDIGDDSFDVIFSKDVFEHIEEPKDVMDEMFRVLKPGGECIVGFGPLWYSPFGDHGIIKNALGFTLPWLHVLIGRSNVIKLYNNSSLKKHKIYSKKKITNLDKYLNFKTGDYFRHLINQSEFKIIWYEENVHENFFVNIFRRFGTYGRCSKYFIRNIYCKLEK